MKDNLDLVGQLVISSSFGLGRVVDIDKVGLDERLFLIVECQEQKVKCFLPVDDKDGYRLVSSKEVIDEVLSSLVEKPTLISFDSKKDRINYFKENSQIQNIKLFAKLLRELNSIDDLGAAEEQIFTRLLETISLEHSIITSSRLDQSRQLVKDSLK